MGSTSFVLNNRFPPRRFDKIGIHAVKFSGMDAVTREFEQDLLKYRQHYAGHPRGEFNRLLLLGLEREQMVTISYRDQLMSDRLRRTPLPPSTRELIRHALIWVWKDEEMHAIYVRGLLLRMGSLRLKVGAFIELVNGTIGGWASSVRLHVPWGRAPVTRALATALQWMGSLMGKVPREVRKELEYRPFQHFCRFNADVEMSASLCWDRMVDLCRTLPGASPELAEEFRRMGTDEKNHFRIFDIIGRALTAEDTLAAGETEGSLAQKMRAIGEEFLPRSIRNIPKAANPLGTGGRVVVEAGPDKRAVLRKALTLSGLPRILGGKPYGFRAVIKPSFMMAYNRRDRSPYVDPDLVDALAEFLLEQGAGEVVVAEGNNLYDRFFRNRSVRQVARYAGFASPRYRVANLTEEQAPHRYGRGMAQYTIGRSWRDADVRIVMGKMRSHPVDHVALCLGALEGIGPRCDEFIFSERTAHRSTALLTLLSDFPPHFAVLDAYDHVPDGILGMMGSTHTRTPRRIYAGEDALSVDFTAARHMGMPDPRAGTMLRDGCYWFGDPEGVIQVEGIDEPIRGWRGPYDNDMSALLSSFAYPFYTFFTGRGALFVPEMDERAFPPVGKESLPLRIARRCMQTLLIMRHMK